MFGKVARLQPCLPELILRTLLAVNRFREAEVF